MAILPSLTRSRVLRGALCGIFFFTTGCAEPRQKVAVETLPLRILIMDRLGVNSMDPLPEEIQSFLMPIQVEACSDNTFVLDARFIRLDLEEPAELVIQSLSDWVQGMQKFYQAQAKEMIEIKAQTALSSALLREEFTHQGLSAGVAREALAAYIDTHEDEQFKFHTRGQKAVLITIGASDFPAYADLKALRAQLAAELCATRGHARKKYTLVYNYYVATGGPRETALPEDRPPPQHSRPSEESTADAAYTQFVQWRKGGLIRPEELIERLKELQLSYDYDFRFPLERARMSLKILQRDTRHHEIAWEYLEMAAEMAIRNGDNHEMLAMLEGAEDDRYHDFWKLATHHSKWHPIEKALKHADLSALLLGSGAHH